MEQTVNDLDRRLTALEVKHDNHNELIKELDSTIQDLTEATKKNTEFNKRALYWVQGAIGILVVSEVGLIEAVKKIVIGA